VSKLLPDFEKNLAGKSPGDAFDFVISAENGYGKRDDKNVIHIPIETFADESGDTDPEMLEIGKVLPMMDNAGNKYHGKIMEVNDEDVLMDFNHPLADRELHFSGEVADFGLLHWKSSSTVMFMGPVVIITDLPLLALRSIFIIERSGFIRSGY
jgi:FKBP-type peptidyl-prolyl cis-trans isomerase 2